MIAFLNNQPLVVNTAGDAVAFRREWLRSRLEGAARRAGYPDWWLADDVATTIGAFLERHYRPNFIETARLDRLVAAALCAIGYSEIARSFQLS